MADGFKNSTKTHYFKGGDVGTKGAAKVAKVMGEFKAGTLHSGSKSGPEVTNRKQATAIALSEARKAAPVKKAMGGPILPAQADPRAVAAVAKRPAMPAQADNAKRVTAMKNGGRMPVESTSARPVKIGPTPEEIADAATVARGNRMQALEAAEEAKLMRQRPVTPVRGGGTQNRALGRGAAADGPVMKPINRKGGGLAVMPRGKKC